jgi:hypothetical protein
MAYITVQFSVRYLYVASRRRRVCKSHPPSISSFPGHAAGRVHLMRKSVRSAQERPPADCYSSFPPARRRERSTRYDSSDARFVRR